MLISNNCRCKYLVPQFAHAYSLDRGTNFKNDFRERLTRRVDSHLGHLFIIGGVKRFPAI